VHLHLLNIILSHIHGLHSYPIKAFLFVHLHLPFSIFPPIQTFLFINPFGLTSDDINVINNKKFKLFILLLYLLYLIKTYV